MGETSEEMLRFADQSAVADSDVGLLVFLLLLLSPQRSSLLLFASDPMAFYLRGRKEFSRFDGR